PRPLEDLATAPVVAATLETLIDGQGEVSPSATRFLHNIQFRNLTFAYAGWFAPNTSAGYPDIQAGWHGTFIGPTQLNPTRTPGNVTFSIASALRFEGNIFTHLGAVGLNLDSGSQGNAIVGNVFRDISSTAIQVGDASQASRLTTDPTKQARNNTIADNYITDVAAEYHDAVGLFLGYHNGAAITHNEIGNLPYSGISIGWGWGLSPSGALTGCDDSFAGNNTVAGNRIHDVMLSRIDGGGIYTLSGQPGSSANSNFIAGNGSTVGLYHDSGTCGYTDQWNVVAGAGEWMSMHDELTTFDNQIMYNYLDVDNVTCSDIRGIGSERCNYLSTGAPSQNYVHFNTVTAGVWPAAAQDIMNQAGLEPGYLGIKSPVCGDATCNAGETASSCPKDCL
ncbi:MAG TPA: right-handed parallel beta-helix repeat-containing protein, partial [Kofleriaceae bacterium]|nr:right-handed parallel beta-helix repeat-containing protein [Kofleriaceae bacterium]